MTEQIERQLNKTKISITVIFPNRQILKILHKNVIMI